MLKQVRRDLGNGFISCHSSVNSYSLSSMNKINLSPYNDPFADPPEKDSTPSVPRFGSDVANAGCIMKRNRRSLQSWRYGGTST